MSEIVVKTFEIEPDNQKKVKGPYIRVVVDGQGCPIPNCNCSPGNFIVISNGEIGLSVTLTDDQANLITECGGIDTSNSK